jgi:hypothetical protein
MSRPLDISSTLASRQEASSGVAVSNNSRKSAGSKKSNKKTMSPLSADIIQQRSSRSLLANVLDLEDDLLMITLDQQAKIKIAQNKRATAMVGSGSGSGGGGFSGSEVSRGRTASAISNVVSSSRIANGDDCMDRMQHQHHAHHQQQQQRAVKLCSTAVSAVTADCCPDCCCCTLPECQIPYHGHMTTSGLNGSAPGYDHLIGVGGGGGSCLGVDVCRVTSAWRETEKATADIAASAMQTSTVGPTNVPLLSDVGGPGTPRVVVVQPTASTTTGPFGSSNVECSLLADVLDEVKYLVARVRRDAETQQACSDWKFAAMVVDRLCLWMFSVFTVVSTGAILLSAPHVVV